MSAWGDRYNATCCRGHDILRKLCHFEQIMLWSQGSH